MNTTSINNAMNKNNNKMNKMMETTNMKTNSNMNTNSNMELRQLLSSSKIELGQVAAFCAALNINLSLSFLGEKTEVKALLETLGNPSYPILDEADNRQVFVDAIDKKFNSIGKHTLSSKKTYKEILDNACKALKVKKEVYIKPNLSYQDQERIIVRVVFEKMVEELKKKKKDVELNAELEAILKENRVDYKKYVGDKRIVDALLATSASGVLSVVVANLIVGEIVRSLSWWGSIKVSTGFMTVSFIPILGNVFFAIAGLSALYALCGANYKKMIPTIVLIASLREEVSTKLLNAA